jgi:hypothetical protein
MSSNDIDALVAKAGDLIQGLQARRARLEDEVEGAVDSRKKSPFRLLSSDEVRLVLDQLNESDGLMVALTCRRFRNAALAKWVEPRSRYAFRFNARMEDYVCSVARLQWAIDNLRLTLGPSTAKSAAAGGYLEVLQHLRSGENPCPWNELTCEAAALGGHKECLVWLRSTLPTGKRCPWDQRTCAAAARHGHLELLRWARQRKAPWDATTCAAAARGGHKAVLEWCRSRRCPWDEETYYEAEAGGFTSILEYALDQDLTSHTVEFGAEAAVRANVCATRFQCESLEPACLNLPLPSPPLSSSPFYSSHDHTLCAMTDERPRLAL